MGGVIPIATALVTVPLYIKLIGPDRYGILATAWSFLGFFGLFDLGLGRATSYRIAALRDAAPQQRADAFRAAIMVNLLMGAIGAGALYAATRYYYVSLFSVSESLRPEIVAALPLLAMSVPVATLTGVLTGALQGRERFLQVNVVSVTSSVLFQILPLLVAWRLSVNLSLILIAALASRIIPMMGLGMYCYRVFLRGSAARFNLQETKGLLHYGGWVTVSSLIGPLVASADRFMIGALAGATAVAIYVTPVQFSKQVLVFPTALMNALFPRMASVSAEVRSRYVRDSVLGLAGMIGIPILFAIFLIGEALQVWISKDIAIPAAPVGRIVLIAVWGNCLALAPYTTLLGGGRPDLVAKILLIKSVPYFIAIYIGTKFLGIEGAALALVFRGVIDYLLLSWASDRQFFAPVTTTAYLLCLVAGAVAAGTYDIHDWQWWVCLLFIATGMSLLAVGTAPVALRHAISAGLSQAKITAKRYRYGQ